MRLARSKVLLTTIGVTALMRAGAARQEFSVGSHLEGRNDLPVDIVFLTYDVKAQTFATVVARAKQAVPEVSSASIILSDEPIADVSDFGDFHSCTVAIGAAAHASSDDLLTQFDSIDVLNMPSAKDRIAIAKQMASLHLEQQFDQESTYRNDALRAELRRQEDLNAPAEQKTIEAIQDTAPTMASDVIGRALAWQDVEKTKLAILHQEVKTLAPLVQQAKLAADIRQDELVRFRASSAAWRAYSSTVGHAFEAGATHVAIPVPVTMVKKRCAGPSAGFDWVDLEGAGETAGTALIAEVSFDRGARQVVLFRRGRNGARWSGRVDWPAEAANANIRVRRPGSAVWYPVPGRIASERPSIAASADEARRVADTLAGRLKDSEFRAADGDHLKTVPVF